MSRKILLAALSVAALAGSAVTAAAAEPARTEPSRPVASEPYRLDDAQMDGVSAGGLVGDINIAIVIPIQIVNVTNIATAVGDGAVANAINQMVIEQTTRVNQRITRRK